MNTKPELPAVHQPLTLAMAGVGERLYGLVRAYVDGPGSRVFTLGHDAKAHALLVDLDNPAAGPAAEEFWRSYGRPVIALSMNEPKLDGAIWVRKPISMDGLAQAAALVRQGWASPRADVPLPGNPSPAPPASTPAAPAVVDPPQPTASSGGAESVPANTAEPAAVAPDAPPKPPSAVTVAMASGAGMAAVVPAHPRSSAVAATGGQRVPRAYWLSGAVVGAAVVAAWLLMPGKRGVDQAAAVPVDSKAEPDTTEASRRALEAAVDSGLKDAAVSGKDAQFVALQLASMKPAETAEQLKARLDALASDSEALRAHNEDVYNKVAVTEAGRGRSPEAQSRRALESIVALSAQDGRGHADGFVGAISTEAKAREEAMRTIVVQPGDTLSAIAKRAYGDPEAFGRIFEANPRVLASPHHIFPGQVLRVPGAAR